MKVCYIGPIMDGTGYSKAAIEYIMALKEVGVDVVTRSIKMTPTYGSVPEEIKVMEQKDLNNVDILIQHNLPSTFVYKGGVLNVGAFAYETNGFPNNNWDQHLSLMDKIIVFCKHQADAIANHDKYLYDKTLVVPHPIDVSKLNNTYDKLDFDLPKNCFKFYTIAEYNRRKNFPALLSAYLSRFSVDDNVALIIKTHSANRNSSGTMEHMKNMIDDIRSGLNRFKSKDRYAKVIIISDYMTNDQINSLHTSCDTFVTASKGESWCLPAIDALGFKNPIIAPGYGAFTDYIEKNNNGIGITVGYVETPVFGMDGAPDGLYSSDEKWCNVNIYSLANAMEDIYNHKDKWLDDSLRNKRKKFVVDNFSRSKIGKDLKDIFELELNKD